MAVPGDGNYLISWVVTGGAVMGVGLAAVEFWAKLVLYYGHERLWARAQ